MIRCPRQLDGRIDHLLAINTVRIALALGLPDIGGDLLWWRSDWELRAHSRQRTIPDALFAVRWSDTGERVFVLELEHGTRAPRSFQTKMLRYSAASHRRGGIYGEMNPIVLVVGSNPIWLARYRAAVAALTVAIDIGFASLNEIDRNGGGGPVWQTQSGEQLVSLRTLANCPYHKDRTVPQIPAESRSSAASAAHKYPLQNPVETMTS